MLWERVLHQGTIVERSYMAGVGLDASIDGEEGLLHAVTSRVVPKSLRVRPGDSSASSSLVETLSL